MGRGEGGEREGRGTGSRAKGGGREQGEWGQRVKGYGREVCVCMSYTSVAARGFPGVAFDND